MTVGLRGLSKTTLLMELILLNQPMFLWSLIIQGEVAKILEMQFGGGIVQRELNPSSSFSLNIVCLQMQINISIC